MTGWLLLIPRFLRLLEGVLHCSGAKKSCNCFLEHGRRNSVIRHQLSGIAMFSLLIVFSQPALAGGLTLFSYYDDHGQLIVVDSLERIPEKFRDQAEEKFIPSFRSKPSEKKPAKAVDEFSSGEEAIKVISAPEILSADAASTDSDVTIMDPPPEREPPDPAFATAAIIIGDIERIVAGYEHVYSLAFNYSIKHPAVLHHHMVNVNLMRTIGNPGSLVFREPNGWAAEASLAIERLRTIQYTVSAWMETGGKPLLSTLPTLTEASRRHCSYITAMLEQFRKEAEERAEERFKKAEAAWREKQRKNLKR